MGARALCERPRRGCFALARLESNTEDEAPKGFMRRFRWVLIIGGPLIIAAVAWHFISLSGQTETTDNAYVQFAKAPVSASVGGRVLQVYVTENQRVKAGQPLFRLDDRDFEVNAAAAQAQLAQAQLQVTSLRAAYAERRIGVSAAEENVGFAMREAERAKDLAAAGVASRKEADEAAHAVDLARQRLTTARQEVATALANLGGDPNGRFPAILAAEAALERARLNQSYTEIVAPTDGVVTRVEQLQPGAVVNPSQTVFWLLTGQPWVEANFKEDQLSRMKIGQPVEIKIDAAKDQVLTGKVASFSPGTGAVFSALPAQNATGNWVKVTQRLPVRIAFDKPPPEMAGRAGLSAHVKVDVLAPGAAAPAQAAAK